MKTNEDARNYVRARHASQRDAGGQPYIHHLEAVEMETYRLLGRLPAGTLSAEEEVSILCAALLHDVVEDAEHTGVTREIFLAQGFSSLTNAIVADLTRDTTTPGTYLEKIEALTGKVDPLAHHLGRMIVKLADNRHNSLPERVVQLPEERRGVTRRYGRSMAVLEQGIRDAGFGMILD